MGPLYEIGDVLRIRQWDDMMLYYGLCGDSINVPYAFTPMMKELCGKTFTVRYRERDSTKNTYRYYSTEGFNYLFSEEMLEPNTPEEELHFEGDIFDLFTD